MCILCSRDSARKPTHHNRTSFRPGPDSRRHQFTADERRRGGRTSWAQTVVRLRQAMNLPVDRFIFEQSKLPF